MKKIIKKYQYILISLLVSFLIIGISFYLKGIYPLGNNIFNINGFDNKVTPLYYKLWDILHGNSSFIYDWYSGTGVSTYATLITNGALSPTSLLVGLFKRDYITYAMSFIIIIKLLCVTLFTYIAIDKTIPKVNGLYKVLGSVLYTFCGFEIFLVSSISYLDVYALFPLLIYSYIRLLKDNKYLMYIMLLTLSLIFSYYMGYLILFFILGVSIISLLTLNIKNKKKKAFTIAISTLISIGLPMIIILPVIEEYLDSYLIILDSYTTATYLGEILLKIVYLLPLSIPIYFTYKQLKVKKDKKINLFIILLLIYLSIGIFIPESINILNMGYYNGYVFKSSFIISYILILVFLLFINNNYIENDKNNIPNVVAVVILTIIIVISVYSISEEFLDTSYIYGIGSISQFIALFIIFIVSLFIINFITKTNKNISRTLYIIFSLIYIGCFHYLFYYNNNYSYSIHSIDIINKFNLKDDNYNYMDLTNTLNINFPYILKISSIENYNTYIKKEEVEYAKNMGYLGNGSYIYGYGGNIFSNLLWNNKYIFSKNKLDDRLYNLVEEHDNYYLYEAKYNLSYLIPYSGYIYNEDNGFKDNINNIYKNLFNKDSDLVYTLDLTNNKVTLDKDNIYYIYVSYYLKDLNDRLKGSYKIYYESYDTYVVEVSSLEDIELDLDGLTDLEISYININDYIDFVNSINNYEVNVKIDNNRKVYTYESDIDTSVLIPINYDDNLVIKVNGIDANYKLNVYNMISIDIKKGYNEIEISYKIKDFNKGLIISIVSLCILISFYIVDKKKSWK